MCLKMKQSGEVVQGGAGHGPKDGNRIFPLRLEEFPWKGFLEVPSRRLSDLGPGWRCVAHEIKSSAQVSPDFAYGANASLKNPFSFALLAPFSESKSSFGRLLAI